MTLSGKRGTRPVTASPIMSSMSSSVTESTISWMAVCGKAKSVWSACCGSSSSSAIENSLTLGSEIRSGGDCTVSRVLAFIIASG